MQVPGKNAPRNDGPFGCGWKPRYAIFKDYVTGLEYIRPCRELAEKGLFVVLGAYQCHVFLDWRFVSGEQWKAVYEVLNGAGVESVQVKFDEMFIVKARPERSRREEVKSEKKEAKKRIAKKPSSKSAAKKSATGEKATTASKRKPAAKKK